VQLSFLLGSHLCSRLFQDLVSTCVTGLFSDHSGQYINRSRDVTAGQLYASITTPLVERGLPHPFFLSSTLCLQVQGERLRIVRHQPQRLVDQLQAFGKLTLFKSLARTLKEWSNALFDTVGDCLVLRRRRFESLAGPPVALFR